MTPCVLCNVDYDVELDDEDDIQVAINFFLSLYAKDKVKAFVFCCCLFIADGKTYCIVSHCKFPYISKVTVTGVCIGLGEPLSFLNGVVEIESSHLQKQSNRQSANSIENEEMMFHMDALPSGLSEKSSSQTKLVHLKASTQQQKKVEKRIRYYVCNLQFFHCACLFFIQLFCIIWQE